MNMHDDLVPDAVDPPDALQLVEAQAGPTADTDLLLLQHLLALTVPAASPE
jgi:hypothetical protein